MNKMRNLSRSLVFLFSIAALIFVLAPGKYSSAEDTEIGGFW